MKNEKILVICGQTATGKTKLALKLAKKFSGEIISADSRQVYKEMDIGTGKDVSEFGNVKVWGIDLVNPNEEFSVSHYQKYASKKIEEILERNKLPIIVGGTGLYIKALFNNLDNLNVKRNNNLRKKLEKLEISDLFNILLKLDTELANSLNNSDKNNKVRLIRKIEILSSKALASEDVQNASNFDVLYIGLKLEKQKLIKKIKARVKSRIKEGFAEEYKYLIKKYGKLDLFTKTPGYKDWPNISEWEKSEIKYAKRQLTWFKKIKNINWFNADNESLFTEVEILINKWHN